MNNIRKIIEERLENARNDWLLDKRDYLRGQVVSYRDCLNLIPTPRTKEEILKDFEKLGWETSINSDTKLTLRYKEVPTCAIWIDKLSKEYSMSCCLDMQEHKLLNELFEVIF